MTRRGPASVVASPVLVGTVTVLIAVVAVFLSYNANSGLPFVPTYDVSVRVPDAQGLVRGNEVRVAGQRVGVVARIDAVEGPRGRPVAELLLRLETRVEPLRDDSEVTVRPRSPLGLKYVELVPGQHGRAIAARGTLPERAAQPTVELDEVLDTFDAATRRAAGGAVVELGTALAGRGADLNAFVAASPPLARRVEDVGAVLSDPGTRLERFVRAADGTARELDAARARLRPLVRGADVTAAALADVPDELGATIAELPPTESAGTRALAAARPLLADARLLVAELRPGVRLLPSTSARLHVALERAAPVLRRALRTAADLDAALVAVQRLSADPLTLGTLRRLRATLASARPTLDLVAPAQLVCNVFGLWGRNVSGTIREGDPSGHWVRTLVLFNPDEQQRQPGPPPRLHVNPYPNEAAPGRERECEAGREPYLPGRAIGNPPGNQGAETERTGSPTEEYVP